MGQTRRCATDSVVPMLGSGAKRWCHSQLVCVCVCPPSVSRSLTHIVVRPFMSAQRARSSHLFARDRMAGSPASSHWLSDGLLLLVGHRHAREIWTALGYAILGPSGPEAVAHHEAWRRMEPSSAPHWPCGDLRGSGTRHAVAASTRRRHTGSSGTSVRPAATPSVMRYILVGSLCASARGIARRGRPVVVDAMRRPSRRPLVLRSSPPLPRWSTRSDSLLVMSVLPLSRPIPDPGWLCQLLCAHHAAQQEAAKSMASRLECGAGVLGRGPRGDPGELRRTQERARRSL